MQKLWHIAYCSTNEHQQQQNIESVVCPVMKTLTSSLTTEILREMDERSKCTPREIHNNVNNGRAGCPTRVGLGTRAFGNETETRARKAEDVVLFQRIWLSCLSTGYHVIV